MLTALALLALVLGGAQLWHAQAPKTIAAARADFARYWQAPFVLAPSQLRRSLQWLALLAAAWLVWTLGVVGLGVAASAPWVVARLWRWRQRLQLQQQLEQQLPAILDALAASLAAGQSFNQAIAAASTKFAAPGGAALAALGQQLRLGLPLAASLSAVAPYCSEWQTFADSAADLVANGGPLSETAKSAALAMRRRQRIEQRLATLTAQGRYQAWVLAALPGCVLVLLRAIEPGLFAILVESFLGWLILVLAFGLTALALWLMRRILAIEI